MSDTYTSSFKIMGKGIAMFIRCWASTLNRLGVDIFNGIIRHWFFALVLVSSFVVMFITMGEARAERDHHEQINYQLRQTIDSLKIIKKL